MQNVSEHKSTAKRAMLVLLAVLAIAGVMATSGTAAPGNTTLISDDGCCAASDGESTFAAVNNTGRYVVFASDATNLGAGESEAQQLYLRDRETGSNEIVTVNTDGIPAQGGLAQEGNPAASISSTGRYVVFESAATNLVPGDTNGRPDVFIRDRGTATIAPSTERVSVNSDEAQGTGGTAVQAEVLGRPAAVSNTGNLVAFQSSATNLVPGDTNNRSDIFVRNLTTGTTERVSVTTSGQQALAGAGEGSSLPSMSGDGRYVAFQTDANNLSPSGEPGPEGLMGIVVRDRELGTTTRVSVNSGEAPANLESTYPSISDDGNLVAFESMADNLTPLSAGGDGNLIPDVFVRDRAAGTTERVSVNSQEAQAGGGLNSTAKYSGRPEISSNGRYVAFDSDAPNLVSGDTNKVVDVFVRDRQLGTTQRASVKSDGSQVPATSKGAEYPSISSPGGTARPIVGWESDAIIFQGDLNGKKDIFVHELPLPGDGGTTPPPPGTPKVTVTTPANNATAVPAGSNVVATFNVAMRIASINETTFKLTHTLPPAQGGGVEEIGGEITLSADGKKATLNPNGVGVNPLEPGKYTATVTKGARSTAGVQLDQDPNTAGAQNKVWTFTVGR